MSTIHSTLALLSLVVLGGCAAGTHATREEVAGELVQRVGSCPGPAAPDCAPVTPPGVDLRDGVTEDAAIALALANNADYQARLTQLQVARGVVLEAGQLTNPQMSTFFPLGPKQWEFTLFVPLEILIQRPQRIAAADLESQRVAAQLVQDGLNLVRDVRLAYADLLLALDRESVARQSLQRRSEIDRRANVRLKAGDVSPLDVATSNVYRLDGQQELARASQQVNIARARLQFLLGLGCLDCPYLHPHGVASLAEYNVHAPCDEMLVRALATRADLLAAQHNVAAAKQRADLAHYDYLAVSAIAPDINSRGREGFEAGPGLLATVPIFHQNQGGVARTGAQLEQARRQYEAIRQQAAWEVVSSHQQFVQVGQQLRIVGGQMEPQAVKGFGAALAAYFEDGTNLLYLLELSRQLDIAQVQRAELSAALRRAAAELERSVGGRVFGVQHATPAEARP